MVSFFLLELGVDPVISENLFLDNKRNKNVCWICDGY